MCRTGGTPGGGTFLIMPGTGGTPWGWLGGGCWVIPGTGAGGGLEIRLCGGGLGGGNWELKGGRLGGYWWGGGACKPGGGGGGPDVTGGGGCWNGTGGRWE